MNPMKEIDVLMLAEAHAIDPETKGLYNFYIDCISTFPPQRTWVGLTDDEILYCVELENPKVIAEEVEAKLKEKNT